MKKSVNMLGAFLLLMSTQVEAAVRKTGTWPEKDPRISLELEKAPLAIALRTVCEKAHWSLVLQDANLEGTVTLSVKDEPAAKVLEMLVPEQVALHAHREDNLVRLTADAAPTGVPSNGVQPAPSAFESAQPAPIPASAASSAPCVWKSSGCYEGDKRVREKGQDREVTGSGLRIEKDEVVHDVTVLGGPVEVFGVVTGDLTVTGGSLEVQPGGIVVGDVTLVGGKGHIAKGGRVDGHVGVVGVLTRDDGAIVGGDIEQTGEEGCAATPKTLRQMMGDLVAGFAMLFIVGLIFQSLAEGRMERLRVEIASRPVRNFALGVVGMLGLLAGITVLCVTVLGIPVALVLFMLAFVAVVASLCATAQLAGEMLLRHKTKNPHVHLALGVALLVVGGALPWIGGWVWSIAVLIGAGALVATRATGLLEKKPVLGPYRTL